MKFRLTHPTYFPTYFRTKKEAMAWLETRPNKEEYKLERRTNTTFSGWN